MLLDRYPLSFFDEVPKHILESGFVLPKTSITETVMSSHINVTEITDLVAWKHLLSEGAPSKSLSLKNTIPIRNDADFVGHFVEALIADTIQVLLSEIMIFAAPPSYQRTKVHDFPGVFSQPDNGKTLKVVLEEHGMRTLNLSATIDYYRKNRAYVYARLSFDKRVGSVWILSKEKEDFTLPQKKRNSITRTMEEPVFCLLFKKGYKK
ncbi:hypothetical protein RhiirA1_390539, partial [Rhizophagus irregularis]